VNANLENVNQWFSANLLSLNLNKTSYMILSRKNCSFDNVTVTLNGVALTRVRETKFLGIILTDELRWKKQVDMVVQKTSKVLGILGWG